MSILAINTRSAVESQQIIDCNVAATLGMRTSTMNSDRHSRTFDGNYFPKEEWDRSALYFQLPEGKKAIADSAYEGIPEKVTVKRDGQDRDVFDFIDRAQNRQEAYHGRLDAYAILRHRFRHGSSTEKKMELHNLCVEALMVFLHFDLHHRPLWEI